MSSNEIFSLIESFEKAFDSFNQGLQGNVDSILKILTTAWKQMQALQKDDERIEGILTEQDTEITGCDNPRSVLGGHPRKTPQSPSQVVRHGLRETCGGGGDRLRQSRSSAQLTKDTPSWGRQ